MLHILSPTNQPGLATNQVVVNLICCTGLNVGGKTHNIATIATIGDKIVETLYLNRVTSENKRIHTPPLSPPFKVGVFVVFYR